VAVAPVPAPAAEAVKSVRFIRTDPPKYD
jgi:hypothetical protein